MRWGGRLVFLLVASLFISLGFSQVQVSDGLPTDNASVTFQNSGSDAYLLFLYQAVNPEPVDGALVSGPNAGAVQVNPGASVVFSFDSSYGGYEQFSGAQDLSGANYTNLFAYDGTLVTDDVGNEIAPGAALYSDPGSGGVAGWVAGGVPAFGATPSYPVTGGPAVSGFVSAWYAECSDGAAVFALVALYSVVVVGFFWGRRKFNEVEDESNI